MARGRPRKTDPDAVLDKAAKLFWQQGFEGTSMNDLASATDMAKPGLYATFGDKEALYAKALVRYFETTLPVFDEVFDYPGSLESFVRRYLETVAEALTDKTTPRGCFIVNSMVDCANQPSLLETLGRDLHKKRRAAIARRFRGAQKLGELPPDADPKALAEFFSGQALALAVMARSGAGRKTLRQFIDVAMTALPNAS
ncbi:TetR/AcrR family transcriptional regulator [Pelagibius sp. Alg239-R121]|uniref:TetR/AcrR family transcriptional regulator n=1 Tax=Pelagibius sp. Alg239-R121 TaxID=2993448 RepID=UPI0024A7A12B|nr:TetR/AcrR family transcriptional regulator [Pelagibius sp. Alg239-R121]